MLRRVASGEPAGKERREFRTPAGTLLAAAFSPDARRPAAVGGDKVARVWDVESGTETGGGTPDQVVFHPDGMRVAAADTAGRVVVWDTTVGPEGGVVVGLEHGTPFGAAFTADGNGLAQSALTWGRDPSGSASYRVVDLTDGRVRVSESTIAPGTAVPIHSAWGQDPVDRVLVRKAGADTDWAVRDTTTGQELVRLSLGPAVIVHAALSPDGTVLAALALTEKGLSGRSPGSSGWSIWRRAGSGTGSRTLASRRSPSTRAAVASPRPGATATCASGTLTPARSSSDSRATHAVPGASLTTPPGRASRAAGATAPAASGTPPRAKPSKP